MALIGCGAVSQTYYAPALRELQRENVVRLVALYDVRREAVEAMRAHFPDASVVPEIEECAQLGVELAVVASPNRHHADHATRLLSLGMAVLCEKPLATSVAQAEAMVAAAARAGRPLVVGHFRRFFPAMQAVHSMIEQGTLGRALAFDFSEGGRFAWPAASAALFSRADAGGGVLIDLGTHLIDLLVWWFGEPTVLDYEDDALGGIEANCRLTLQFAGEIRGYIRLSRDHPLPNRCVVRCERGSMQWNVWDKTRADELQLVLAGGKVTVDGVLRETRNMERSFIAQIRNAAQAARGLEQPTVPGEAAIATLRVVERAYRVARPMPMAWLSERERAEVARLRPPLLGAETWTA